MRSHYFTERKAKAIEKNLPTIYRLVWKLMYSTGLRIGDAVAIRECDIDSKGYLHYTAQKTGKVARVKLSDDLIKELRENSFLCGTSDGFVFFSPVNPDAHISRQAVWKNIKKAFETSVSTPTVSLRTAVVKAMLSRHITKRDFPRSWLTCSIHRLQRPFFTALMTILLKM